MIWVENVLMFSSSCVTEPCLQHDLLPSSCFRRWPQSWWSDRYAAACRPEESCWSFHTDHRCASYTYLEHWPPGENVRSRTPTEGEQMKSRWTDGEEMENRWRADREGYRFSPSQQINSFILLFVFFTVLNLHPLPSCQHQCWGGWCWIYAPGKYTALWGTAAWRFDDRPEDQRNTRAVRIKLWDSDLHNTSCTASPIHSC